MAAMGAETGVALPANLDAVFVCPLHEVPFIVTRERAKRLVTLLQDEFHVETPEGVDRHLRLHVDDITQHLPYHVAPQVQHVSKLLSFAEEWGGKGAMVIHCWAGISRSTAAAFTSLCLVHPGVPETSIARALRRASPTAQPNRLIVQLADEAMGRKGRMVAALEEMGPAVRAGCGVPFSLRSDPDWLKGH